MDAADFYTGIVAEGYALLKSEEFPADRYATFIEQSGQPALELGCGDGDPLLELRRRGLDVEGVDSSADLLAKCAARAEQAGLSVATHQQRFEDLDLPRQYRSIFFAGPTFNLLPDDDLGLRTLNGIRDHLTQDGTALVPLWVPQPADPSTFGVPREAATPDGSRLTYTALGEDYDASSRTRTTHTRYERHTAGATEATESVEREWVIHWHTPATFRALAEAADLQVAFTDPDGAPLAESWVANEQENEFVTTLAR